MHERGRTTSSVTPLCRSTVSSVSHPLWSPDPSTDGPEVPLPRTPAGFSRSIQVVPTRLREGRSSREKARREKGGWTNFETWVPQDGVSVGFPDRPTGNPTTISPSLPPRPVTFFGLFFCFLYEPYRPKPFGLEGSFQVQVRPWKDDLGPRDGEGV